MYVCVRVCVCVFSAHSNGSSSTGGECKTLRSKSPPTRNSKPDREKNLKKLRFYWKDYKESQDSDLCSRIETLIKEEAKHAMIARLERIIKHKDKKTMYLIDLPESFKIKDGKVICDEKDDKLEFYMAELFNEHFEVWKTVSIETRYTIVAPNIITSVTWLAPQVPIDYKLDTTAHIRRIDVENVDFWADVDTTEPDFWKEDPHTRELVATADFHCCDSFLCTVK